MKPARIIRESTSYDELRDVFVQNYLDGDGEGGVVTVKAKTLADEVADIFCIYLTDVYPEEIA